MKIYEVGGCVRDELLGLKSKDIDYTVVLDDKDVFINAYALSDDHDPFIMMYNELLDLGFKIFLETPEFLTIRAQFPKDHPNAGLTADFVLARKESDYKDGRRPDEVVVGTLEDDLARRDFTMNAVAKDEHGVYIDPHNGITDIENRLIRAVGDPWDRFDEDALRAVRALRFYVTKDGFRLAMSVRAAMEDPKILKKIKKNISDERIREELNRMMRYDTLASLKALGEFPLLTEAMFSGTISLEATMKTKGRGKK